MFFEKLRNPVIAKEFCYCRKMGEQRVRLMIGKYIAITAMVAFIGAASATAKSPTIDENFGRMEGPRDLTNFKLCPANWNDASGKGLDFMAGSWIGSNDSTTIEEVWTPLQGSDWFGVVKTKMGDKIQIKVYSFRYSGSRGGIFGTMRIFDKDLENASERITLKQIDNHEPGAATLEFGDGSISSYKSVDAHTLHTVVSGKELMLKKR